MQWQHLVFQALLPYHHRRCHWYCVLAFSSPHHYHRYQGNLYHIFLALHFSFVSWFFLVVVFWDLMHCYCSNKINVLLVHTHSTGFCLDNLYDVWIQYCAHCQLLWNFLQCDQIPNTVEKKRWMLIKLYHYWILWCAT